TAKGRRNGVAPGVASPMTRPSGSSGRWLRSSTMERSRRAPAVAGQFYEAESVALTHQIEGCFTTDRGPGELPPRHRSPERRIRAAIVPHAGYAYSGPIAALAYAAIAAERPPHTVLLLGVDHHGAGVPAAVSDRDWTTPLGPAQVDHDLVRALARGPIEIDEASHAPEHSLEVQVPFLQYVLPAPRFAGLMVRFGSLEFLHEIADVVREAIRGRDILVIASTDFSHYVSPEEADRLDHLALDAILARDPKALYETVVREDISMCGIAPTTVLLATLSGENLGCRLLRWGHSGEAEPMRRVVGYASLLLESPVALH
ncbi:MAG: AmmeMemoRadiSam system protein B, partial [Thermoplasmata archaeon]|nr:AmmeMemoRadiSam system protein B [Thermoplasmata archaeon]